MLFLKSLWLYCDGENLYSSRFTASKIFCGTSCLQSPCRKYRFWEWNNFRSRSSRNPTQFLFFFAPEFAAIPENTNYSAHVTDVITPGLLFDWLYEHSDLFFIAIWASPIRHAIKFFVIADSKSGEKKKKKNSGWSNDNRVTHTTTAD